MQLAVEILTGCPFHIEIHESATVADLKKAINQQEALDEARLILVLKEGIFLHDVDRTLADYGVGDGSHIYLFFTVPSHGPYRIAPRVNRRIHFTT